MDKKLLADLPVGFMLRVSIGLLIFAFFVYAGVARRAQSMQFVALEECGQIKELQMKRLTALEKAKALSACMTAHHVSLSGIGGADARSVGEILEALPATPCKYIGVWYAFRPDGVRRVTLKDNSDLLVESIKGGEATAETGFWGVHKKQLAMFYESRWPPDINKIEIDEDGSFMLNENNNKHAVFVRDKSISSTTCSS